MHSSFVLEYYTRRAVRDTYTDNCNCDCTHTHKHTSASQSVNHNFTLEIRWRANARARERQTEKEKERARVKVQKYMFANDLCVILCHRCHFLSMPKSSMCSMIPIYLCLFFSILRSFCRSQQFVFAILCVCVSFVWSMSFAQFCIWKLTIYRSHLHLNVSWSSCLRWILCALTKSLSLLSEFFIATFSIWYDWRSTITLGEENKTNCFWVAVCVLE